MKKKLVLLLMVVMACLFGCGKEEQTPEEIKEQLKDTVMGVEFKEEKVVDELAMGIAEIGKAFDDDKEIETKYMYQCKESLVNPTETDFEYFSFNIIAYDKEGNEEEVFVMNDNGSETIVWKAGKEYEFETHHLEKWASYEIESVTWKAVGDETAYTVKLTE